jgi:hypothetical protein
MKGGREMPLLTGGWGATQTVLLILAAIIVIVLIVLMSTKKPGPETVAEDVASGEEETAENEPEVGKPEEHKEER